MQQCVRKLPSQIMIAAPITHIVTSLHVLPARVGQTRPCTQVSQWGEVPMGFWRMLRLQQQLMAVSSAVHKTPALPSEAQAAPTPLRPEMQACSVGSGDSGAYT